MDTALEAVLRLTDRVQGAIDAGDWQLASDLEVDRRRMLEELVTAHAGSASLGGALTALEPRNQGLIGVVRHHQRRVLREAATVKTAHARAAAYAVAAEEG